VIDEQLKSVQMDDQEKTVQSFTQDIIDFDYGFHPK
jgi:hypothetical protein